MGNIEGAADLACGIVPGQEVCDVRAPRCGLRVRNMHADAYVPPRDLDRADVQQPLQSAALEGSIAVTTRGTQAARVMEDTRRARGARCIGHSGRAALLPIHIG